MIETEKDILAATIEKPECVPIIIENCEDEFFQGLDNQQIFKVIKDNHKDGKQVDWTMLVDLLSGIVSASYISGMMLNNAKGLPPSRVGKFIFEKISLIREEKAKKQILQEISEQANYVDINFDKIIELANEGNAIRITKEQSEFKIAYEAYLDWKERRPTNIKTGFPTLDNLTDDYNAGEIVSFMGRTTTGKTFISLNILDRLVKNIEDKIGFFSLEMSKSTLIERMMQIHFKLSRHDLVNERRDNRLDENDFLTKFNNVNIYSKIYSVPEIATLVRKDKLKIVFIDYLQILKKDDGKSLYEKTSYRMQELKEMAKNEDVVIFLLIQISRKGEGGWEPVTIDMARDSGAIEENSDFIFGIWCPILKEGLSKEDMEEWADVISIKLLKNKRGAVMGIKCNFNKLSGRIYELGYNSF